ncbi:MAG: DUF6710 family protein [Clostridia bacterium]
MFKFFKKEKVTLTDFTFAFKKVNYLVKYAGTDEEKITILNSAIEIVKSDIKYSLLSDIIYKDFSRKLNDIFLAPFTVITENRIMENHYTNEEVVVDLSKSTVITIPWSIEKFVKSILTITKNDFINFTNNHKAYYFADLDIAYVYNGIHSSTAGSLLKKGFIKAEKVDMTMIYPYIYYKDDYAYSSITNEKLSKIVDFRLALLFELGKLKYNILTKTV